MPNRILWSKRLIASGSLDYPKMQRNYKNNLTLFISSYINILYVYVTQTCKADRLMTDTIKPTSTKSAFM